MPHDRNGVKINAGDVVTMRFTVQSVDSAGETGCNVTLIATGNPEGEYAPVLVCNTRLVEKPVAFIPANWPAQPAVACTAYVSPEVAQLAADCIGNMGYYNPDGSFVPYVMGAP